MEGIINHKDSLPVTKVVLIDIPEGEEKVSFNTAFAKRMAEKVGLPISVRYTLDRRDGLKDASFVIVQIRVGGLDAREKDERIPLKYDVIGQETTGPVDSSKHSVPFPSCASDTRLCKPCRTV